MQSIHSETHAHTLASDRLRRRTMPAGGWSHLYLIPSLPQPCRPLLPPLRLPMNHLERGSNHADCGLASTLNSHLMSPWRTHRNSACPGRSRPPPPDALQPCSHTVGCSCPKSSIPRLCARPWSPLRL